MILADDKFEVLTLLRSHRRACGRSTAGAHDGAWAGHTAGQMAAQVTTQLAGGRVQPGTPNAVPSCLCTAVPHTLQSWCPLSCRDDAKGMAIMARHPYPIHTIRLRQPLAAAALEGALAGAAADATLKSE